jgi:hypothetical protein
MSDFESEESIALTRMLAARKIDLRFPSSTRIEVVEFSPHQSVAVVRATYAITSDELQALAGDNDDGIHNSVT